MTEWKKAIEEMPDYIMAEKRGLLIWQEGESPSTWTWDDDINPSRYLSEEFGYTHWMYLPELPEEKTKCQSH